MKAFLLTLHALLLLALPWQAAAQVTTTETFETVPAGATTFTSNGQGFTVTSAVANNRMAVWDYGATFGQFGWNGTAPDNRALSNESQPGIVTATQNQFTVGTTNGAGITVKSFWVNLSSSSYDCTPAPTGTFTVAGKRSGTQVFTASVPGSSLRCGPDNQSTFNGYNLIDLATFGGANNANTTIDELVITSVGQQRVYVILDAFRWATLAVATAPTVSTTTPASISTTGATLGGNVTATGGATVTERGVVYVAGTGTPTTTAGTKLSSGTGTGSFTVNATGLTAGTQYTVRAYAINSAGTSYGSAVSFTTSAPANQPPVISNQTRSVAENAANGTSVGAVVTASDPDAGQTLSYAITGGNAAGKFAINPSTGQLTVAGALDFEAVNSYPLTVTVTDNAATPASSSATVTVSVTNVNEAPTGLALSNATLAENNATNALVGTLSTTDPDAGDTFTYSLVAGAGSTDNASFSVSGNSLRLTASADFETKSSYAVRLRTTDAGGLSYEQAFTVTITNVNEAPVAVNDALTVAEDAAATTVNVLANDSDPDAGTTLTVAAVTQPATGTVTLTGGVVRFTPAANFNGSTSFTYTISDGALTSTATVTVTVTPVNDPPTATNDALTVNQTAGPTVVDVLANDTSAPDTGETLTVTAVTQPATGLVTLSGGVVRYAPAATFAGSTSFTYTISDGNGGTATATVAVTVVDTTPPTVTLASSTAANGGSSAAASFAYTVTFSENVTGFVLADVSVSNGTPTGFAGSGSSYSFSVTPTAAGPVTVSIPVNVAQDASGNGNSASTAYTITFAPTATLSASISSRTNVSCNGGATGAATVTATGGTAPYTYLWSNGATTASISGLTAGTYSVTVTDAANRTTSASATITEPTALTSTVAVTSVACFGGSTGAINLTPAGGTAPYTFNWGGGIATEDRTNLAAGTYSVTITDANGCTRTQSATVGQPAAALSATTGKTDVTTNGGNDGTATVTPAGGTAPYSYLWSNSATTPSIFGLTAGTYSVTVTDAKGCTATGSATVGQPAAAPQNLTISTGTFGAPVAIAAGTYNNVTITGTGFARLDGAATVNGTLLVQGSLNTNCQALTGPGSFTLAGGATLYICDAAGITASSATGAVQLTGTRTFSPDASYAYNGTAAQATGTGLPAQVLNLTSLNASNLTLTQPVAIRQALTLNAGSLNPNGQALTLLSDASGTALIANLGSGNITGNVTVQRYIDGSLNSGLGYRHLAAPVTNATVASFGSGGTTPVVNGAYNTAATPGSVTPFPTVFTYNQARLATSPATTLPAFDKGWQSPTALNSAAQLAYQGFTVQLPGASTLTFTGTVATGSGSIPLSRNSGATAADAGWNLIGNPYPAPLDLSTIPAGQRVNMDAAFYTFESTSQYGGTYRSFVNGIGNPLLGSSQAFFVRVSAGQTSGSLDLTNANRVTDYAQQAPVRRGTADSRPQLQLTLSGAGLADALTLYAETGATAGFDKEFDAAKLWNPSGLSLATVAAAGEALAIDGRSALSLAQPVPLTVQAPRAGQYTLTAATLANLPAGARLTLVDLLTGTRTPLLAGTSYVLTLGAGTTAGRLQLESAAAPLATAGALAQQLSVYPNPTTDGLVQLVRPAAWGTVQVLVLNAVGQTVHAARLTAGEPTLDLRALASGVYSLRLTTQDGQTLTKRLVRQ